MIRHGWGKLHGGKPTPLSMSNVKVEAPADLYNPHHYVNFLFFFISILFLLLLFLLLLLLLLLLFLLLLLLLLFSFIYLSF